MVHGCGWLLCRVILWGELVLLRCTAFLRSVLFVLMVVNMSRSLDRCLFYKKKLKINRKIWASMMRCQTCEPCVFAPCA